MKKSHGLKLKYYPMIAMTRVMRQAHINYSELISNGAIDGMEDGVAGLDQAHVLLDDQGDIRSLIVWRLGAGESLAWITQSWTHLADRRKGLHSRLFKAMCKEAKRQGAIYVVGNIRHDNVAMIEAAKKTGRTPSLLMMDKKL